jgi:formamidopyrimidine-DNA glycosylase
MPELPEVEYIRRKLDRWARGAEILAVVTTDARLVRPARPRTFVAKLAGRTVDRIERRGKWIRCLLDDRQRLFVHLGMTGWFEREAAGDPANPHASAAGHLRFERLRLVVRSRARTSAVVYVDPRRWGRFVLTATDLPAWTALGPDPLDDGIDLDALRAKLARRKRLSIKEALMDQTVLAGIGNIQAIEALWKARVDPRSTASAIDRAGTAAIARGIRWTIGRTLADLEAGGPRPDNPFKIYGRKGEPCPRCGHILDRTLLGGRTTTFCPGCQSRRR